MMVDGGVFCENDTAEVWQWSGDDNDTDGGSGERMVAVSPVNEANIHLFWISVSVLFVLSAISIYVSESRNYGYLVSGYSLKIWI